MSNHEYRKLQVLQKDLTEMEHVPQGASFGKHQQSATQLGAFDRAKQELARLLADLRTGVDRLNELRGKDTSRRDVTTIRLRQANASKLVQADGMLAVLERMQQKAESKKRKKKSKGATADDRREWLRLLQQEVQSLRTQNERHQVRLTKDERVMLERRKQRRERLEAATRKRSRSSPPAPIADHMIDVGPRSAQELAFERATQENIRRENQMPGQISIGLDDLDELARRAGTQLAVQDETLHRVDSGMDRTITTFRAENRRLKDLLASSGGAGRWCPVLLCLIVLLALIGYTLSLV
jgi:hypothetical protein